MLNKIETIRRGQLRVCDSVQLDSGIILPCVTGQCSQVDTISHNGYRYKNGFWDKVLGQSIVQDAIQSRDMLGMIEHPTDDDEFLKTPYDGASHIVIKAWCCEGNPFATFGLLNNERGNQLKALIDVGHKPGVSTRGLGSFNQDDKSQFVEDDNYMLITWDIVRSPNFADLKMDKVTDSLTKMPLFKELTEMYNLRDSIDSHFPKNSLKSDMDQVIKLLTKIKDNI